MKKGFAVLAVMLLGCGGSDGFGVGLALRFDETSVSDAALASVTTLQITSSGDEAYSLSFPLSRTLSRTERLVYRPRATSHMITIDVAALDASGKTVAAASTGMIELVAGKLVDVEVDLEGGGTVDLATPGYASVVLADSPVAYYRLDDTGNTATDSSGHGNDGIWPGTVGHVGSLVAGGGGAARMPGGAWAAGHFITVPHDPMLEPTSAGSVEAWISASSLLSGGSASFVAYGPDTNPFEPYEIQEYQSNISAFFSTTSQGLDPVVGGPPLDTGVTHHVVGTYDGTVVTLYVDGVAVDTNAQSGVIMNYDEQNGLAIGSTNTDSGDLRAVFDGTIDEVAVYDHALSAARVEAHYVAGLL